MFRPGSIQVSARLLALAAGAFLSFGITRAGAATPFTEATVTRLQNKVAYGVSVDNTRPAVERDVIKERNFLLTETDSRAELKYPDGSIARLGQNTIFSFQAEQRLFELKKGTFLIHVPDGKGGGIIKTPSFTAAITGTTLWGSKEKLGSLDHSLKLLNTPEHPLKPGDPTDIPADSYATRDAAGNVKIEPFDPKPVLAAELANFNGKIPPFDKVQPAETGGLQVNFKEMVDQQESFDRTIKREEKKDKPKEEKTSVVPTTPTATPVPPKPKRPHDSGGECSC